MELFGNIAVITGAASGIGYITAHALYLAGAFVYVTDIDERRGREAFEQLRKYGNCLQTLNFVQMDVTDTQSITKAAGTILDACGSVDILVNTVGWEQEAKSAGKNGNSVTHHDTGPAHVSHAFLPSMMNKHKGKIINVTCDFEIPKEAHETIQTWANRGAMVHTEELADEMAQHGINVNCICISSLHRSFHDAREKMRLTNTSSTSPANSEVPAGIAEVTLLFAGDASNDMTGQTLQLNYP